MRQLSNVMTINKSVQNEPIVTSKDLQAIVANCCSDHIERTTIQRRGYKGRVPCACSKKLTKKLIAWTLGSAKKHFHIA